MVISQGEVWWDEPTRVEVRDRPWVDCEALDRRDPKRPPLQMQVQRAMVRDERYSEWRDQGRVGLPSGTTAQQAPAILKEAIENKRSRASSDVILLLDADRLPWLALRDVIAEFRRLYGESARRVGFRAIYVVPWHVSAIAQLDTP